MATLEHWIEHLRAIAGQAADTEAALGLGDLETPFRAAVQGGMPSAERPEEAAAEIALWWGIVDNSVDVGTAIALPTEGGLFPQGLFRTIEVWTEADLSGLHALSRLARLRARRDWADRVAAVRDWHVEHTQPDNATNRPWALHVFLLGGTPESTLYAETLLHNCMAVHGRPTPLCALILLDCANELAAYCSSSA